MEQTTNRLWVVEINGKSVHNEAGEAVFTDEWQKTRMFPTYEEARIAALMEWECKKRLHEITFNDYYKGEAETYQSTEIFVMEYAVGGGEYLFDKMMGHLTSWDFQNRPQFSELK